MISKMEMIFILYSCYLHRLIIGRCQTQWNAFIHLGLHFNNWMWTLGKYYCWETFTSIAGRDTCSGKNFFCRYLERIYTNGYLDLWKPFFTIGEIAKRFPFTPRFFIFCFVKFTIFWFCNFSATFHIWLWQNNEYYFVISHSKLLILLKATLKYFWTCPWDSE